MLQTYATDRNLAYLSSERLYRAANGKRCRDPQPNIRWSSGSLSEELGKGLRDRKMRTPQEDKQSQLTWTLGGLQRLNHQPKSRHGLDLGPPHIAEVQLGLHVGSPTTGAGVVPETVACLWIPFTQLGCLIWPQWERMYLVQ